MTSTASNSSTQKPVRTALLLVVLAYILIYLLPLGIRPLSIPDETRYGEIPHEMITTGDWAVPHLVGLRYFEKPPLGYWLNAVSLEVFGENNFAVRFPTALTAGMSAWFIWFLLIRLGYSRRTAIATAAVYLSMVEVLLVGTIAVLDTPFTVFLNGGMILWYLGFHDPERRRERTYLIFSGILFGLAFLTKGFLAMALPGLVFLFYFQIQKRFALLKKTLLVAGIGILVTLPWDIIIGIREPDFWRYFIMVQHIRRFIEPNAQHPEPFYFFIMYLPAMAFPWLAYLPAAFTGIRQQGKKSDFTIFLLLWAILPFIFFSISHGKLTTYVLPVFAPLAAYTTIGLIAYYKSGKRRLFTLGAILNTALILIALAFVLHQQYYEPKNVLFATYEAHKMYILIASIVLTAILSVLPALIKHLPSRIGLNSVSVIPLFLFMNLVVPHSHLAGLSPLPLIQKEKHLITPNTIIVTDANVVRAVAWELKRTDVYLIQKGELAYGLSYPDSKNRYLGIPGLKKLLEKQKTGTLKKPIAVFCSEPCAGATKLLRQYDATRYSDKHYAVWLASPKQINN